MRSQKVGLGTPHVVGENPRINRPGSGLNNCQSGSGDPARVQASQYPATLAAGCQFGLYYFRS